MKIFTVAILWIGLSLSAIAQKTASIEKSDCFLDDCESLAAFDIEYGFLNVPEDYDNPSGKHIRVPYGVVKSQDPNPEPDPVLVFQGGTGIPILHVISYYATNFPVKNRDIIIYDYRGTGYAEPKLCPELGQAYYDKIEEDLSYDEFTAALDKLNADCLREINAQGIDFGDYSMGPKTRDAVHLLEQLGYKDVNLYGVSNGTASIQAFLRAAESSDINIRSILSDSNVPMALYVQAKMPLDYKEALHKVLRDCSEDPDCEAAYPDLEKRFRDFLKKTMSEPLVFEGDEPFALNYYEINGIVHRLLYANVLHKDIPLLLDLFIKGDIDFFSRLNTYFNNIVSDMNGTSIINYTYDWNLGKEDIAREYAAVTKSDPEYLLTNFWLTSYFNDTLVGFDPMDSIPVTHDAPALVMAGGYDPVTPPAMSEVMHKRYRNSFYYVLPRVGHGAVSTPCGESIYQQFIEDPSTEPAGDCVDALASEKTEFTTSVYHNQQISKLATSVIQQRNIGWILAVAIPLITSIILIIIQVVRGVRKKRINIIQFTLALLISAFIIGLGYYLQQTAAAGGITILFGLTGGAWWLPWVALLILLLTILLIIKIIVNRRFTFWRTGMLVASVLTLLVAFTYDVFPF